MKATFSRAMSVLCILILLAVPASTVAESTGSTIELNIGSGPTSFTIIPASGLNTGELFLDQISYDAHLNPSGGIILRTGDLTAAVMGGNLTQTNGSIFSSGDFVISNGRLVLGKTGGNNAPVPDIKNGYSGLSQKFFTKTTVSNYNKAMQDAQTDFRNLMNNLDPSVKNALMAIYQPFVSSNAYGYFSNNTEEMSWKFQSGMKAVYQFLFQLRQALARLAGTTDVSKTLKSIGESKLMSTFIAALKDGGFSMDKFDFWNSEGWETYTKNYLLEQQRIDSVALEGKTIQLSDSQGNSVNLLIQNVWQSPIVHETGANDVPLVDQDVPLPVVRELAEK